MISESVRSSTGSGLWESVVCCLILKRYAFTNSWTWGKWTIRGCFLTIPESRLIWLWELQMEQLHVDCVLFVTMDNSGWADVHFDALSYVTAIMFLISEKTAPSGRENFCVRNYALYIFASWNITFRGYLPTYPQSNITNSLHLGGYLPTYPQDCQNPNYVIMERSL